MLFKLFVFKLIVLVLAVKLNLVSGLDKKSHCTCKANVQPNIVGGKAIEFNHLPWMASVTDSSFNKDNQPAFYKFWNKDYKIKDHKCTAFILNESWVITSRDCTQRRDVVYSVGFGYDKLEMFGKKTEATEVISDEDLDVSLLKLSKPISFDENIRPACIDTKLYELVKNQKPELMAAGFGKTASYFFDHETQQDMYYDKNKQKYLPEKSVANIYPRYLKEVDMIDVSDEPSCRPGVLCAKNKSPDSALCRGDEGGPLHYAYDGKMFVVGLLRGEFSKEKRGHYCDPDDLVYYNKMASIIDFITDNIGNEYCDDKWKDKWSKLMNFINY